jgi:glycosyltransferase involved in cell wall biosynthesis
MHVCLTCIELFADSIYGGFGRATRFIGRELVRRGVKVSVVVPRRSETYPERYELDGMTVQQYRPERPWQAVRMFRNVDADVYHSQDTSLGTFLAQIAAPSAAHVVTFRDPMDRRDWQVETDYANMPSLGWTLYRLFIGNPLVTTAIRRADGVYCAAEFLIPKTTRLYGLRRPPGFLPSPVQLPTEVRKAEHPAVCYVGRWEGRKRVELFFELAEQCPDVEFIAVGGARDRARDRALRERYGRIPNVWMTGVLDQFVTPEWSEVLGRSWILVNSSLREGLPTTFIEAAAHRCAILSFADPDGFATRFGRQAREGGLREGLLELLRENRWAALGEEGRKYVERVFSVENAMDAHLRAYEAAIRQKRCGGAGG